VPYLPRYRAMGDPQLFGGPAQMTVAASDLEGAQGIKRQITPGNGHR
jgi:hypothetical protein